MIQIICRYVKQTRGNNEESNLRVVYNRSEKQRMEEDWLKDNLSFIIDVVYKGSVRILNDCKTLNAEDSKLHCEHQNRKYNVVTMMFLTKRKIIQKYRNKQLEHTGSIVRDKMGER